MVTDEQHQERHARAMLVGGQYYPGPGWIRVYSRPTGFIGYSWHNYYDPDTLNLIIERQEYDRDIANDTPKYDPSCRPGPGYN